MKKSAILIGATGLVGSQILKLLLEDERYNSVKVLHRRSTGADHPKLTEHIIHFDKPDEWKNLVTGNHLFSALGTTIKNAGSKEAQYKIDYTYQFEVAEIAAKNGIQSYTLISSLGANAKSNSFYPKIKGELDEAVLQLSFDNVLIVRPSFLDGNRNEFRFWERTGIAIANVICKIPGLRKYHPIKAETVAKAMIEGLNKNKSGIVEGDKIHDLI